MTTRDELEMKYITENSDEVSNKYKTFHSTLLSLSGVSCWENPDKLFISDQQVVNKF